ncbi:hypothetical protein [Streptomyces sp. NPDC058872]|uniref:hypothetical protein n=1 Tax=Streptomyces sp. NPDC058872 TaxID=3346661 RepID=UPI0036B86DB1
MAHTAWRIVLGTAACGAFFWGVAGAVHLGLVKTHRGWSTPEGGGWFDFAMVVGLLVGYFTVASLTDRIAPRYLALIPAVSAAFGSVCCLALGQQTRHWVAALTMAAVGVTLVPATRVRERSEATRRRAGPTGV